MTKMMTCGLRTRRNYPWMEVADADHGVTIYRLQRKALV